jgi:enterobacteria phage integrase
MIRPRDRRRRDWPTGLREPRPGYFTWRNPATGEEMAIGRVTLAQAKREAQAAVEYVISQRPSLLERLTGSANTVADLLDRMPESENPNTAKSWRSLDKKVRAALGDVPCTGLTVAQCAELLDAEAKAGRARTAEALRARLVAVCKKGVQLGWLEFNPAEPTETEAVTVKRSRLTLEQFHAVLEKAPAVNEWLRGAMLLAVVSGQDRSTLSGLRRSDVGAEYLTVRRGKTGVWIEIPLALRLDALGITLKDALEACKSDVRAMREDWVLHHAREYGNAPLGSRIHVNLLSRAFQQARALAGIDGENPPTFHEIRSLTKRLYKAQGGVDSKALLGHLTEKMSDTYADPRGAEPIRVKLG